MIAAKDFIAFFIWLVLFGGLYVAWKNDRIPGSLFDIAFLGFALLVFLELVWLRVGYTATG